MSIEALILTAEHMWVSTAEDELNYFSGYVQPQAPMPTGSAMPSGTYRIVDGSLYLILPTAPTIEET